MNFLQNGTTFAGIRLSKDRHQAKTLLLMTPKILEAGNDEAAGIMLSNGISGMPVVSNRGKMEGIITKSDIFRCFVSFTGTANKGQVFAFNLQEKPGIIKNLTDMIRSSGGRLCSIMTSYDDIEEGFRKVFFHTFDIDPSSFDGLVEKFHGTGELIYVADLSLGFRKIF